LGTFGTLIDLLDNWKNELCVRAISDLLSTIPQDRFTKLAILSIENEIASSNDFSDFIKDFVAIKSRNVQF
jgi:hypothetical protein